LQERGMPAHVLIQKSAVEFLRPIDGEFTAVAVLPGDREVEGTLEMLREKRRGRLGVESQVLAGETVAAVHSGVYVAILR
jgi:thioesterase domain-containing protein